MMKQKLLLLFAILATAINASAANFNVKNDDGVTIYYNKLSDGTSVEVTYRSASYNSYSGNIIIPKTVTYNSTEYTVTSIGTEAFKNCSNMTSVTIPETVTSIGTHAFYGCSSLSSITIPSGVTSIGNYTFYGCPSLSSITILGGVTSIGNYAFYGCSSLSSITIPDGVTSIGNAAFQRCSSLTTVNIPANVTSIGEGVFGGCSSLTSFTGKYASTDNRYLVDNNVFMAFAPAGIETYEIPEGITKIGNNAFYDYSNLKEVTIPESLTAIGNYAFSGCSGLTKITSLNPAPPKPDSNGLTNMPTTCIVIVPNATAVKKYSYSFGWQNFTNIINAENLMIRYTSSDGQIEPTEGATFGEGVTYNKALSTYADGEGKMVFDDVVTQIGEGAFKDKTSLTTVTIPESVTEVGASAFSGCTGLTIITSLNETPPTAQETTFSNANTSNCKLIVPAAAVAAYQVATGWKDFTNLLNAGNTFIFYTTSDGNAVTPKNDAVFGANITSNTYVDGEGKLVFDGVITKIGEGAFQDCTTLTSVVIPVTVTELGASAFSGCTGLTEITSLNVAPPTAQETTFSNANNSNCKVIVSDATAVTAYSGATGWSSFSTNFINAASQIIYYTSSGGYIVKPTNTQNKTDTELFGTTILSNTYENGQGKIVFDGDVTKIVGYAFYKSTSLTSVVIPNKVTEIGNPAFSNCTNLASVTIPESVVTIGQSAFNYCQSLASVTIPNSVTEIQSSAFSYCSGLTEVTIGNSVTTIGNSAFSYCTGLTSMTIPNSVTTIESLAFSGCTNLASVTIPGSVTSIGNSAFSNCTTLTSIEIPNSVTSIGTSVFVGCTGLTEIKSQYSSTDKRCLIKGSKLYAFAPAGLTEYSIPNDVRSIGLSVFNGCTNLTSVTIPEGVSTIETYAFKDCTGLTTIISLNETPPTLDGTSLENVDTTCIVIVPTAEAKTAYKAANNWKKFTIINAEDQIIYYTSSDGKKVEITKIEDFGATYRSNTYADGQGKVLFYGEITKIVEETFKDKTTLTSVTIPESVTEVGTSAFSGCTGLKEIISLNANAPTAQSNTFTSVPKTCKVIVPNATAVANYKAAEGWKDFFTVFLSANQIIRYASTIKIEPNTKADIFGNGVTYNKNLSTFANGKGMIVFSGEVTKMGASALYNRTTLTSVTIPTTVTEIGASAFGLCKVLTSATIPASVTTIGASAFSGCTKLTSATISKATEIGASAFAACTGLTSVTIGDYVKTIGTKAFSGCKGLTELTIPGSVTSIGASAFANCTSLKTLTAENSKPANISLGETVFSGVPTTTCVLRVPSGSKELYEETDQWKDFTTTNEITNIIFYTCNGIITPSTNANFGANIVSNTSANGRGKIVFDDEITEIGTYAFQYKSGLSALTIPNSVTKIKASAFQNCSSLKSVTIPEKVTDIQSSAFSNCKALATITSLNETPPSTKSSFNNVKTTECVVIVPTAAAVTAYREADGWKDFTYIVNAGTQIIYYTSSDKNVVTPAENTIADDSGALTITSNTYADGHGIMVFSGDITTIGEGAFKDCTTLTSVEIPSSVTTIGEGAFTGCNSLESFTGKFATTDNSCLVVEKALKAFAPAGLTEYTIPNDVTSIGASVFSGCTNLKSVVIPEQVTSIGASAFSGCEGLKTIISLNTTPPTAQSNTFDNVNKDNCKVLVPTAAAVSSYMTADVWKDFANITSNQIIRYKSAETVGPNEGADFGTNVNYNSELSIYNTDGKWSVMVFDADITKIGDGAFKEKTSLTSLEIPESATEIGASAFSGCSGLTSMEIPDQVISIGASVFADCSALTEVTMGESVTMIGASAFQGCTSLTGLTNAENITEVGDAAFSGCTALTEVTIPSNVETIGDGAFANCTNLASFDGKFASDDGRCLVVDGKVIAFAPAELTNYEIPSSVTEIGASVFSGCTGLTEVTIGESVGTIGASAFSGCSSLTTITSLCETPPTLDDDCFNGITTSICILIVPNATAVAAYKAADVWKDFKILNTENMTIRYTASAEVTPTADAITDGSGALTILSNTYDSESKEGTIIFSGEVTEIGNKAFENCTNLTSVTIPATVTSIGNWAFYNTGLTTVDIPTSVTSIGTQAFTSCHSLASFTGNFASSDNLCLIDNDKKLIAFAPAEQTSYTIPSGVTKIGEGAFINFTNLTSVTIPDGVTEIETNAFAYSGLTSVEIPSSVTTIGASAFHTCSNLTEVTSLRETPPTLGNNCFYGVASGFVIKVPGVAIGSYHSSWTAYQEKLQAISLALTDDAAGYTYNFDFVSGETTYTRNFPNDKWQGLFLPFAMSYSDWSDKGEMAQLTGVGTDGVLEWKTIDSGSIEAGKPYIFKPNEAKEITFKVTDAAMQSCATINNVTYSDYTLSGTYTTKDDMATSKIYALYNGDFYYTTDNSKTLKPYRIYLTVPAASSARIYSRINGDNVTAIEDIDVDIDVDGQRLYNLQGIRVDDSYKGIVIINGKKVVRK